MKAIVLAAGLGTRLHPLTATTPKALLDVAGRPLLEHVLRQIAAHGFDTIAINLHHHAAEVRGRIGDGRGIEARLKYVYEPELLGTAGTVARLAHFIGDDNAFLVHYGDVLTDHDLGGLARFHRSHGRTATVLVHRRERSNSRVTVAEDGRVLRFDERPAGDELVETHRAWVNSGVYMFTSDVFDQLPVRSPSDIARDVLPRLAADGELYAQPLSGCRYAIDSPARYREAIAGVLDGTLSMR
jgi:mannose-1-phosphate guanylyltransferase